jgi:hypothetical protein
MRLVGAASTLTVGVALVLIGATTAWAGKGPVVHQVSAGGPDACVSFDFLPPEERKPGCDANWSLVAKEWSDGSVSGQYTDRFANGDGFHAVVDCLSVSGNDAWIGGVITHGRVGDFDLAGLRVLTRVQDNGTSANDPPDKISLSFIDEAPNLPDCTTQPDLPLFDAPQGQVKVS